MLLLAWLVARIRNHAPRMGALPKLVLQLETRRGGSTIAAARESSPGNTLPPLTDADHEDVT
jgi:hypothetical protein